MDKGEAVRRITVATKSDEQPEKELSHHQEQFLTATRDGNINVFVDLLSRKDELEIDLEYEDINGDTALKIAIKEGYSVLAKQLLKQNVKVTDALLKAVDVGFVDTVKVICEYASTLPTRQSRIAVLECHCDDEEFHPDVTPIILAAQRNDFALVQVLLDAGSTIPESVKEFSSNTTDSLRQTVGRLEVFKGLASEAYVTLKYPDPVDKAFVLSSKLQKLSETDVMFKSNYLELVETLNCAGTDIISKARSTEEILTVLSHHDKHLRGVNMGPLPKLTRAIQFEQRKFVAEPNCQQAILSKFYGRMSSIRDKSATYRLFVLLSIMITYPLLSIYYLYVPGKRMKTKLESPYVKFMMHMAADFYFIVLITADVLVGENIMDSFTLNRPTRALVILWTLGLAWKIINIARKQQVLSNLNRGTNIRNGIFVVTVVIAALLDVASFYDLEHVAVSLNENVNTTTKIPLNESSFVDNGTLYGNPITTTSLPTTPPIVLSNMPPNTSSILHVVPILPNQKRSSVVVLSGPSQSDIRINHMGQAESLEAAAFHNLQWWHPRLISSAMFSIATVMAFMRMLSYAVVSDVIGPFQISLGSMISRTLHFFLVLIVVIFSIAMGITYIYSYYNAVDYQICIAGQEKQNCETGILANILKVIIFLVWSIFGLANRDDLLLDGQAGLLEFTGTFLYGFFYVIVVLVLLNALIAVMSGAYNEVEENADVEWKFASTSMWIGYLYDGNVVPPPFNLLPSFQDMSRGIEFIKKLFGPKQKTQMKTNLRQHRIKYEGLKLRNNGKASDNGKNIRRSSIKRGPMASPKTQYQRIMSRLVERYVASKMSSDVSAETEVNTTDVRALRNDLLSLKFETFQKMQETIEEINRAIGAGNKTHEKSVETNRVFTNAAVVHSTVKHHLRYICDFKSDLKATVAAIPDPPETTERETQTVACNLTFNSSITDNRSETPGAKSNEMGTNVSCQTSTSWMTSTRTQTTVPYEIQEKAIQTTREYLTDGACQTKPPKLHKANAKTQTHAFALPGGLPFKQKRKHTILSCLTPVSELQHETYQTTDAPSKVTLSNTHVQTELVQSKMCDASLQTCRELVDQVSQTLSKESNEVALQASCDLNEIAVQAAECLMNAMSQTSSPPETKEVLLQTTREFLADSSMQTPILDVNEGTTQTSQEPVVEIAVQATECVVNAISQTAPPETKEALLQTSREFLADNSMQTPILVVDEVTTQTLHEPVVEIAVQATECVTNVMSQTVPPDTKEALLQTTREFLADNSMQTPILVFDEVPTQTLQEPVVEIAVQATECVTNVMSQTVPPDTKEALLQTTREFLADNSMQTPILVFDEVTTQTLQEPVVEIAVQATECVTNTISQTTPPETKEAFLQTTREFLADISMQTTIRYFSELTTQTLLELNDNQTQTATATKETFVQTTIKDFDDRMIQCAPPIESEAVQTSREHFHDIETQFMPSCEETSAQTELCVTETSMQTYNETDTIGVQFNPEVNDKFVQTAEENAIDAVKAYLAETFPFLDLNLASESKI